MYPLLHRMGLLLHNMHAAAAHSAWPMKSRFGFLIPGPVHELERKTGGAGSDFGRCVESGRSPNWIWDCRPWLLALVQVAISTFTSMHAYVMTWHVFTYNPWDILCYNFLLFIQVVSMWSFLMFFRLSFLISYITFEFWLLSVLYFYFVFISCIAFFYIQLYVTGYIFV